MIRFVRADFRCDFTSDFIISFTSVLSDLYFINISIQHYYCLNVYALIHALALAYHLNIDKKDLEEHGWLGYLELSLQRIKVSSQDGLKS
jgi:hypothetical protein